MISYIHKFYENENNRICEEEEGEFKNSRQNIKLNLEKFCEEHEEEIGQENSNVRTHFDKI